MRGSVSRSRLLALTLTLSACYSPWASAGSFDTLELLSQDQFKRLSENLAAATHYKGLGPAEPLGIIGLDVGIEVSSTEIDDELFDDASNGDFDLDELIVPRLHVNKGLPFGFDVGATVSAIPDTDISLVAAEIKYAILDGSTLTPALSVRGSYSRLQGLSDLDLDSAALEITASKGFLVLTPYVGVGVVRTTADPGSSLSNLSSETFEQEKYYAGVTISLGFALTLEADFTDGFRTYSAKAGIRF